MLARSFISFFLFALVHLTFAQTTNAKSIEPQEPLKLDWEDWNDRRNSTGGGKVRIGLMPKSEKKIRDSKHFYVLIPKTEYAVLKVIIKSFDGRYKANELSYSISDLNPGIHQFVLPTKFEKRLLNYKSNELSILAMLFDKDSDEECKNYLISGWNKDLLTSDFVLNVSSRTAVQIIKIENFKKIETFDCVPINYSDNEGRKTYYYNYKCVIPKKIILENSEIILLKSSEFTVPQSYPIPYLFK